MVCVTVTGLCALDGNQRSLCLWAHGLLCLCCAVCFLLSIVCPLPSCYQIIVSVAPPVSPLLPLFVSLFSLLVSVVLCWSVDFRPVCMMFDCVTVLCQPACFSPSGRFLLIFYSFYYKKIHYSCTWVLASSLLSYRDRTDKPQWDTAEEGLAQSTWLHFL